MIRRIWTICIVVLLLQLGLSATASASEETEHAHEWHSNTLFGFIGITDEDRRDRAITVAIEYERRFSEQWGLSGAVEHAFGDLDFTLVTLPLVFHHGKWGFYAGPGIEKSDGHDKEFLVRVGTIYEFEVGELILAPNFSVDFVDGDAVLVGGISIGLGF